MPVLSIGTGGTESANATAIVRAWLELGGRGLDTAMIYRDQAVVAGAVAAEGVGRGEVFITTKIPTCGNASWTKSLVEADLRELGTSYIDLMLIHFPTPGVSCRETWATLEGYHAAGVLKSIGVSNFKRSDLEPILAAATVVPAVNQVKFNVFSHDDELASFAQAHSITLEAYSPLGRSSRAVFENPTIRAVGQRHNVSASQVALRWILQLGHVLTFQSSSRQHQAQDADVFGFSLTPADMDALNSLGSPHGGHLLV